VAISGNQRAIRGHQWQSVVIRDHQRPDERQLTRLACSAAAASDQRSNRNQRSSEAINETRLLGRSGVRPTLESQSEIIRGN
jgi:hypothetical protein